MNKKINYQKYKDKFSKVGFWNKLKNSGRDLGIKTIAYALILYYILQKDEVPAKDRTIILGSLGYLILPTDLLPDFLAIGYTDDLLALLFAIKSCIHYIDDDVRSKVSSHLKHWFKVSDEYLDDLISKIK